MNDPLEYIHNSLNHPPKLFHPKHKKHKKHKKYKKFKRVQLHDDGKISKSKLIKNRALVMRMNMTRHEKMVWEHLKKVKGFIPQVVIHGFIADFGHPGMKVAIEIDGDSHKGSGKFRDEWRTGIINKYGWIVFRFTNDEVEKNVDTVMKKIKSICISMWPSTFGKPYKKPKCSPKWAKVLKRMPK